MTNLMVRPTRFNREVDSWFDDFFRFPMFRSESDAEFVPRVNIAENDERVTLVFEVPGMDKKDIKVTVKDKTLSIRGERRFERKEENGNLVRQEIRTGSFCRSFSLPDTVSADKIAADYKNGLLEVTMPKREEVKPKEIDVNVK